MRAFDIANAFEQSDFGAYSSLSAIIKKQILKIYIEKQTSFRRIKNHHNIAKI